MELCFKRLRGRSGIFMVALTDVLIGFATGLVSLIGILYTSKWDFTFSGWTTADYVKNAGLWSILVVAVAETWSGSKLFSGLCLRKPPQLYFWKFVLYLIPEIGGFIAPFFIVTNYTGIIDDLMTKNKTLFALYLLKFNVLTILLFIFQVYSFFLVRAYGRRKEKSLGKLKSAFKTLKTNTQEIPLVPIRHKRSRSHTSAICATSGGNPHPTPKDYLHPSLGDFETPQDALTQVIVHSSENHKNAVARDLKMGSQFYEIKEFCLKRGILFEDPEFPMELVGISGKVEWKRPREIHPNPEFITEGVSRFDVVQGKLGDCWFLAALANLTLHESLFHQVVPKDNFIAFGSEYAGIFHFRFKGDGAWKDVVIDDRLPTQKGQLLYARSSDRQEFWSCLLEKAYAKFKGSYPLLKGGLPGTAMKDFTGKPVMQFDLLEEPPEMLDLFELLNAAMTGRDLVSACKAWDNGANLKMGIPGGHAYSITGVKEIHLRQRRIMLVRIRNPWGNGTEWKGNWGDRHPLWSQVSRGIRKELELIFQDDGEFWMPVKDFLDIFDILEICLITAK